MDTYGGKYITLHAIAAQDKIFTAADVMRKTGLERQLVYYHLGRFVKTGFVEKSGRMYLVVDRESIIKELTSLKAGNVNTRATETQFLKADPLNKLVDYIRIARGLDLTVSRELKSLVNDEINRTIASLVSARQGLNGDVLSKASAAKKFLKRDNLDYEDELIQYTEAFNVKYWDKSILLEELRQVRNDR